MCEMCDLDRKIRMLQQELEVKVPLVSYELAWGNTTFATITEDRCHEILVDLFSAMKERASKLEMRQVLGDISDTGMKH